MNQQDCLIRFLFSELGVRGEWVRLQHSWQEAKQYQQIVNTAVDSQLGQALAAVVLLSATIKFNGRLILQIQGSGQLKALIAQASHDKKIRGLVRSESEVLANSLSAMLGDVRRMVITVESDNAEPYQGIVAVDSDNLAGILQNYFDQSEQLPTQLWLFANQHQAAGLFIQAIPGDDHQEEQWQHISTLAATVTEAEMFQLNCEDLLHRLFHQEQVTIYPAEPVTFSCGCSRNKISNTLLALGRNECEAILNERDVVEVDCQFCGAQYQFDKVDIENILTNPLSEAITSPHTRH